MPVSVILIFKPIATLHVDQYRDFGVRAGGLGVPVHREGTIALAFLLALGDSVARLGVTPEEMARMKNEVLVPASVWYIDPTDGNLKYQTPYLNENSAAHFGIPAPPDGVVGHLDDPNWLPKRHLEMLRQHIFAGLDVLLPLFADSNLPWTTAGNKAAQEVLDFFPLAAEPGLWPYYKAEGKEFFEWVEKNGPHQKAVLPWHSMAP